MGACVYKSRDLLLQKPWLRQIGLGWGQNVPGSPGLRSVLLETKTTTSLLRIARTALSQRASTLLLDDSQNPNGILNPDTIHIGTAKQLHYIPDVRAAPEGAQAADISTLSRKRIFRQD